MQKREYYNLVFITTFINHENIQNLINSTIENNKHLTLLFIIINQTQNKLEVPDSLLIDFYQINTDRLSLSKARNTGINHLLKQNIIFGHIMFPDDDTTFSDTFFYRYNECIRDDTNYLIDVHCFGSEKLFKSINFKNESLLKKENHSAAMSVNMIICYNTFKLVGLFDERIGIGTKFGSGEDGDYFIRSCDVTGNGFIYQKKLFNFHPASTDKFAQMSLSKTIKTYISYGDGAIFVLCKHKMYKMALVICIYALGGAVLSLFKFKFKLFLAYQVAFFTRLYMYFKCRTNAREYSTND